MKRRSKKMKGAFTKMKRRFVKMKAPFTIHEKKLKKICL